MTSHKLPDQYFFEGMSLAVIAEHVVKYAVKNQKARSHKIVIAYGCSQNHYLTLFPVDGLVTIGGMNINRLKNAISYFSTPEPQVKKDTSKERHELDMLNIKIRRMEIDLRNESSDNNESDLTEMKQLRDELKRNLGKSCNQSVRIDSSKKTVVRILLLALKILSNKTRYSPILVNYVAYIIDPEKYIRDHKSKKTVPVKQSDPENWRAPVVEPEPVSVVKPVPVEKRPSFSHTERFASSVDSTSNVLSDRERKAQYQKERSSRTGKFGDRPSFSHTERYTSSFDSTSTVLSDRKRKAQYQKERSSRTGRFTERPSFSG